MDRSVTTVVHQLGPRAVGWRPAGGFPPTGGGWCEYHSSPIQLTTRLAPPWLRAHSAKRPPAELPRAGLVSALPTDTASHATMTTMITTTILRIG